MTQLALTNEELLTTTRAVRKRLDFARPVENSVIEECLKIALQAPSGSNSQGWHFMIVTDQDKKNAIAKLYRQAFEAYRAGPAQPTHHHTDDPTMANTQEKVLDSAQYLADNLEKVPAFLIPCVGGRVSSPDLMHAHQASIYGSIIPATWSFMLAARTRGLGTCWTTLHLTYEKEVSEILSIPFEEMSQIALIPVAYSIGTDFKPARRKELDGVVHYNSL